jgi:putative ABC transport system permease protein
MPAPHRDPLAVRLSLALLRSIRAIVPAGIRQDWLREWEAEIRHRWSSVNRGRQTRWQDHADVVRRSTGAISDAAWLRQQFTADHDLMRDVQYALRMLSRRPVISTLAVAVLAIGIGGTVAVFSVVDTLLLRQLPYRNHDEIVTIWLTNIGHPEERDGVAPGAFKDWHDRSKSFSHIAAAIPASFDVLNGLEPETLVGAGVTEGFFEALGVQPILGRLFVPREYSEFPPNVTVISHGTWQRMFAGDPSVIGRKAVFDGQSLEIVGVLPRWFHPTILGRLRQEELWVPATMQNPEFANRRTRYWGVVARLASGIDIDSAQAELTIISEQLAREYPLTLGAMTATVVSFRDHLAGPIRDPLRVLLGAVVLVLMLGCANVASLLLARASDRQREFAVRAAIGANRWRLIRQTLVESLVLSILACVFGLAIARTAIDAFVAIGSTTVPQLSELALDGRLVVFALATSAMTAILVGLWPAIRISRTALRQGLTEGAVSTTGGPDRRRLVSVLVVSEVALALVILVTAGLLIRSFVTLVRVDPGFAQSNVAVLQVFAYGERQRTPEQRTAFFDQTLEGMRAVPGVEKAGIVTAMPFMPANINILGGFRIDGRPAPPEREQPVTSLTVASPDYFPAMRIPLRSGRLFTADDHAQAPQVAIVNDLMADRFWPGGSPIDQRITVNWQGRWRTMQVVGVVGRLRHDGLDSDPRPEVFIPFAQLPYGSMTYVVRTTGDAASLLPVLKGRIWDVDPTLALYETSTVEALVAESLAPRRFITSLLGILAALAFVLATIGIYGIVSFATAQRTREIGVRVVVGGSARDILTLVFSEGARRVGMGILLGLAGSLAATRVVAALLYQVSPTDPLTLGGTAAAFAAVALLACYWPARRATRVDPLVALRTD